MRVATTAIVAASLLAGSGIANATEALDSSRDSTPPAGPGWVYRGYYTGPDAFTRGCILNGQYGIDHRLWVRYACKLRVHRPSGSTDSDLYTNNS